MTIDNAPGPSPLQWFLAELDRMPGCQRTKERTLQLMARMAGQRMRLTRRDLVLPDRIKVIRRLLDSGIDRAQIVTRCAALFGVTPRHARSLVTQALTERAIAAAALRQMPLDLGGGDGTV